MTVCGGKTRSGGLCQRPAGWGTDHVGEGKCKLHAGATPRGVNSPHFKHGIYAKYTPERIQEKVDTFADADPFDLTNELALMRALLSDFLQRFEIGNLPMDAIGFMASLIADISRLVERIAKIKNDSALTAAEVQYLQVRAVDVALKYFPNDPIKQEQFVTDLFGVNPDHSVGHPQLIEGKASGKHRAS